MKELFYESKVHQPHTHKIVFFLFAQKHAIIYFHRKDAASDKQDAVQRCRGERNAAVTSVWKFQATLNDYLVFHIFFPFTSKITHRGTQTVLLTRICFRSLPLPKSVLCFWPARYDFWRTRHLAKTRTKWRATFIACSAQLGQKQTKLLRTAIERLWIIVVALCVGCSESTSGVSHLKDIREVVHSAAGSSIGCFLSANAYHAPVIRHKAAATAVEELKSAVTGNRKWTFYGRKTLSFHWCQFLRLMAHSDPPTTEPVRGCEIGYSFLGEGGEDRLRHRFNFVAISAVLWHSLCVWVTQTFHRQWREGKCVARSVFEGQFLPGEVCFLGVGSSPGYVPDVFVTFLWS